MTDQANKPTLTQTLVKARAPRGLADRGPAEIASASRMMQAIREIYELYGFEAVETAVGIPGASDSRRTRRDPWDTQRA